MTALPTDDEDLVWHYTDAAGLHGIVSTHLLRATATNHLNDAAELREGWQRMDQAVSDHSEKFGRAAVDRVKGLIGNLNELSTGAASTYSISASTDKDNLSLWRYYGGRASYAIGLDKTVALGPYTSPERLHSHALPEPQQDFTIEGEPIYQQHAHAVAFSTESWIPVIYDPDDRFIRNHAYQLLEEAEKDPKISLTNIFFQTYKWFTYGGHKHNTFSAEKEVRQMFKVSPEVAFANYRPSPNGLVRYLDIAAHSEATPMIQTGTSHEDGLDVYACFLRHGELPIRAIRLGPTGHRDSAAATIENFLELHGYKGVHVSKSESPFIG